MAKDIPSEIAALRKKLAKLEARRLAQLREKRKEAQKVVAGLDAQIAAISGKAAAPTGRRKRTSPKEMRERIFKATKRSLTQKEISDETALPYGSVVQFLLRNEEEFKITGKGKQKRYLWKGH